MASSGEKKTYRPTVFKQTMMNEDQNLSSSVLQKNYCHVSQQRVSLGRPKMETYLCRKNDERKPVQNQMESSKFISGPVLDLSVPSEGETFLDREGGGAYYISRHARKQQSEIHSRTMKLFSDVDNSTGINASVEHGKDVRPKRAVDLVEHGMDERSKRAVDLVEHGKDVRSKRMVDLAQYGKDVRPNRAVDLVVNGKDLPKRAVDLVEHGKDVRSKRVVDLVEHGKDERSKRAVDLVEHGKDVRSKRMVDLAQYGKDVRPKEMVDLVQYGKNVRPRHMPLACANGQTNKIGTINRIGMTERDYITRDPNTISKGFETGSSKFVPHSYLAEEHPPEIPQQSWKGNPSKDEGKDGKENKGRRMPKEFLSEMMMKPKHTQPIDLNFDIKAFLANGVKIKGKMDKAVKLSTNSNLGSQMEPIRPFIREDTMGPANGQNEEKMKKESSFLNGLESEISATRKKDMFVEQSAGTRERADHVDVRANQPYYKRQIIMDGNASTTEFQDCSTTYDPKVTIKKLKSLAAGVPSETHDFRKDEMKDKQENRRRINKKRTESESEEFLGKEEIIREPTLLYIIIQQLIDQSYDITDFLLTRMESGKDLNFKVKKKEQVRGHTVISLEFESRNHAHRASNLIKLSNSGSQMKVVCTFYKEEAMEQAIEKDEEELEKQMLAIRRRSTRVLENHDEKIKLTSSQIQSLQTGKHVTLDEFESKRIEKDALTDKLTELKRQRDQFITFRKSLKNTLTKIWENNTYTKQITDLRREFGVECCRLENALPMYARRYDIIRTVKENQVTVVLGETGSGKSTQMTQYLHQAGFSQDGIIVCTQPRKVAATSLATHVALEMATNIGNVVGYKVGMRAKLGGATKILYMTDHCLLNECLKDPSLSAYSCVIVDEAHERSIYTDLLLGMLKRCLKERPELKAIITSATIDPEAFVHYFGGCPILRVSGRMFPVEVVYEPEENGGKAFDKYVEDAVNKAAIIHKEESPGDILVFVTTPLETEKCSDKLTNRLQGRTDFKCLILHGQIQPEDQQKVFQPSPAGVRKIVFATNSAETSITIPGIKYVIDTGLVKEKRYDPRRNMSSLSVVVISRSSANQRKGRAGRTGPGKCYRLYTEQLYKDMEAVGQPEILKVHLGQAMLKLTELGINPIQYDFVQSPGASAIAMALETLEELGAVKDNKITEDGKELAKLPLEPRLGRIIQKGRAEGAFFDAVVLAAVSSMGSSIFYRGGSDEDKKKADQLKMQFCHIGGDSLTLLNVYRQWIKQPDNQKSKWCFDNAVNSKTIQTVRDTVNEITTVLRTEGNQLQSPGNVDEKLQKILFDIYVPNICHFLGHARAGYYAERLDQHVHAHPSSVLNPLNMMPEWLVFEQSLKTSRDFITGLTPVNESWIVEAIESGRLKRNIEDMRNKTLFPVVTEHVGSQMFCKIVGPCFTELRNYEAIASVLVKPALVLLETLKDKGELKVYSFRNTVDRLSQLFQPVINSIREKLLSEDLEVPLSRKKENGNIRVVLGSGGAVKDVLMSDEYRTVFVEKTDETVTEVSVTNKLSQFGKIKEHKPFKHQSKRWGRITFESANAAKLAVQQTKADALVVAVPEKSGSGYQNLDFKVKITWCRRASKGFGYVNVEPEDISRLLHLGHVNIRGNPVTIQLNRQNQQSLYLRNLGPDVTEDDIKKVFLEILQYDEGDTNMRVTVVREKVDTSQQQLDIMKHQLEAHLKNYSPEKRFNVEILQPFPSSRLFRAFATFTDANEGIASCQGLSKQMLLNGRQVTLEPDIKSSLFISKYVYDAVREDLEEYFQEFPTFGYLGVTLNLRPLKNGNVFVDISGSDALMVAKVRINLQEILQGDVLECGTVPNLRFLFTKSGRDFLKDMEKKYGACFQLDGRTLSIFIRGKQKARFEVNKAVHDYLQDCVEGESKEVHLRGRSRPKGLMKTLMNEYGFELQRLQQETGLRSIMLNFKLQVVKMTGTADNIFKATAVIDRVTANKQEDVKEASEDELPDCSVCLCPIEDKDLYRLEYCGHAYCWDCFKQQVECAVNDKEFPLLCVQDDCKKPFVWRDLSNLVRQGIMTVANLTGCSLSSFVKQNSLIYHFCPTPNCNMVYRVTTSGAVFQCPECDMRICTCCHTQSHDGLTCAMYRSAKEDESLDVFLSANSQKMKKCPDCTTPIEKTEGCNNMHCQACKCSFCWLCLASFRESTACYAHLTAEHGGCF